LHRAAKMKAKLTLVFALSTIAIAGVAHAQDAPPGYPQQYLAHVSIHALPSTQLEVVPLDDSGGEVASCTEYCDFWALPGRYTLYARDHSTGERKDLSLRIKQSSRFEFQAGDDSAREVGLGLGIGGSVSIIAGFVLIAPALLASMCEGNCSTEGQRNSAAVGLGFLLAGAITAPIGWTMFVHNRTRLKRIDERSYQAIETTSQVRLGVVSVGLSGLGLGGVAVF